MSAKKRKFSAARAAWPRAWVMGRPVSNVSSSAIREARDSMPSAIRFRICALALAGRSGHGPSVNAAVAAVTARSTSCAPPAAAVAYGRLLTGSATSNVAPSALSAGLPAMKCSRWPGRSGGKPVTSRRLGRARLRSRGGGRR